MNNHIKHLPNGDFEVIPLEAQKKPCWCHTCRPINYRDPDSVYMRLCPECGNKRCPKATNHELDCTNSNESNQEGSIY